jgi:5'-3' exoribonuclease 1
MKYLRGRGIPGTGGLVIGDVHIRIRVVPLQGMRRDPKLGSTHKVFGTTEADLPIQMALWEPPVEDQRFIETPAVSVESFMPVGSIVLPTQGKYAGVKGVMKSHLKGVRGSTDEAEVEFAVVPDEAPFGYNIAASVGDEYYSSREICRVLQIAPSLLGRLVGSLPIEDAGRNDLGLNFKRNGMYMLLGYSRCSGVDPSVKVAVAWKSGDAVKIVGSAEADDSAGETSEVMTWEYTEKAVSLLADYKANFPQLFCNLEMLPYQPKYKPEQLFGEGHVAAMDAVLGWMRAHGVHTMPRTPLTTTLLSKEAFKAIERAADKHASFLATLASDRITVRVRLEHLICADNSFSPSDAPLNLNRCPPRLGDRIVNLSSIGVPFAHKGTVVGIHSHTGYIEVIDHSVNAAYA